MRKGFRAHRLRGGHAPPEEITDGSDSEERQSRVGLLRAADKGQTDRVRRLLEKRAYIERRDCNGHTPLHLAVRKGHRETVQLLLECGANVNAESEDADKALNMAVRRGHRDMARLLIQAGADVRAVNSSGDTALHDAARLGPAAASMVDLLLRHGADPAAASSDGGTPLHSAAACGSEDAVRRLLRAGAGIAAVNWTDQTVLHCAVMSNELASCSWMRVPT